MGEPAVHIAGVLCRVKISPIGFIGTLVIALLSRIGDKRKFIEMGLGDQQSKQSG